MNTALNRCAQAGPRCPREAFHQMPDHPGEATADAIEPRRGVWLYLSIVALAVLGSLAAPTVAAQPADLAPALQKLATCESRWAEKRTAILMSPIVEPGRGTLVGCHYFYQQ